MLRAITSRIGDLDKLITPAIQRDIKVIDPIELAIPSFAYEMKERLDVPYRVVINEGVELVKRFGGTDGHRFINSVLDHLLQNCDKSKLGKRRLVDVKSSSHPE